MALPALYRPTTTPGISDIYLTVDGWGAGATDTQGTEWGLTSVDGWSGSPEVRLTGSDRAQDHGQFDGPSWLASRIITVQGEAQALDKPSALLAADIVSSVCSDPTQLYTLQVTEPGRPTRRASVRLNAATKVSDLTDTSFAWQIQFKAPDPRRYDATETVLTLYPPTGADGGLSVPVTVPFSIATSGVSSSMATVTNAGTVACRPVVTLAGPLVDPQIANVTAGRTLSLTITLVAGDTLILDFDRRSVLLNGTASRSSTITASAAWWELPPGGSDLVFTAGGGSGSATVRFRSSWL